MAKCSICGKGAHFGNQVSHSNRKTSKMWSSNIQKIKCKIGGGNKKINVCTRCIRSGAVERA